MEGSRTADGNAPQLSRGRSAAATALGVVAALAMNGCAVIGAGIGSAFPKYEPLPTEPLVEQASIGQQMRAERASSDEILYGRYGGVYDGKLWVDTKRGARAIPEDDVRRADVTAGDHWFEGFLIGLGVDIATIAIVGANIDRVFPKTNRQTHVGGDGLSVSGR